MLKFCGKTIVEFFDREVISSVLKICKFFFFLDLCCTSMIVQQVALASYDKRISVRVL